MKIKDTKVGKYFFNILIWIDQGFNTILGGSPDHTISGRVGYHSLQGRPWAIIFEKIINAIFFFDKDHCRNSIEWDIMARLYPTDVVGHLKDK